MLTFDGINKDDEKVFTQFHVYETPFILHIIAVLLNISILGSDIHFSIRRCHFNKLKQYNQILKCKDETHIKSMYQLTHICASGLFTDIHMDLT